GTPVLTGARAAAWAVAGAAPLAVVFPASTEEVAAVLARATAEGWRVVPAGAGRWPTSGNAPPGVEVVLSTARMDRIVQYEPADLTLTAQAGVGLAALQERAAAERQWLPLDPPGPGEGTLGATLSTASAGPLQAFY